MPTTTIDRLLVHTPATVRDGERLARAIAERLPGAIDVSGRVASLDVRLTAAPDHEIDRLADLVVSEIVRQLRRTLG